MRRQRPRHGVIEASRYVERRRSRVYLCPVPDSSMSWDRRHRWLPRSIALQLLLLLSLVLSPVLLVGCVTRQVANRSVLEEGARGDGGVKVGRLPACEKGQVAGEGGTCIDVVVPAPAGQPATLRERLLLQDCEKAKGFVVASVRRRDQVVSAKGHDVHLGLNAIAAECRARQEQLDICTRAGRYDAGSPHQREEVRLRDGLATCNELAQVYREMLAKGLRRAP